MMAQVASEPAPKPVYKKAQVPFAWNRGDGTQYAQSASAKSHEPLEPQRKLSYPIPVCSVSAVLTISQHSRKGQV